MSKSERILDVVFKEFENYKGFNSWWDNVSDDDDEEILLPTITGLAQLSEAKREEILKPFTDAISYVEKIEDPEDQKMAYLTILRALSKALYSANNYGHFGLGSTSYSHFTSPIRRYPDIIIQGDSLTIDGDLIKNAVFLNLAIALGPTAAASMGLNDKD